jgi:uncharacterized phage-associated protein
MAYRALEIAKYILAVVSEYGDVITNLKLCRLVTYETKNGPTGASSSTAE